MMSRSSTIRKAVALLTPRERWRGGLVLLMALVMACLETAGVASVMPFLAVLASPEMIQENPALRWAYDTGGFESTDRFLIALGIGAFVVTVLGALFRILTRYAMHRFTEMRRHSVGSRLLGTYLRRPYAFFLQRHSMDLVKSILSEVDELVMNVLKPVLNAAAYAVIVLALIILLVVMDPVLAVVVGVGIGGTYVLIYVGVQGYLGRIGNDRALANRERFTTAGEALGGIKAIKVLGRESAYLTRFQGPSRRFARHQATNVTVSEVPKYVIEAIGFGGVIALALYLLVTREDLGRVLPLLGLYTVAGYRLLPAAQQIYSSVSRLKYGAAAVEDIHLDLSEEESAPDVEAEAPLAPREEIRLEGVSFAYPEASTHALTDVTLSIPVGTSVGFVGTTGAGKTTAVDLLLGLLTPERGSITVDGTPVGPANRRAWQASIGYVPQDIFLTDSSVTENIALGVDAPDIDHAAVERAARVAQVHDFITDELPEGYATTVGEKGMRLSGGQLQRIGIARALYRDPPVLLFDEATSALDTTTEAAVMKAVEALHGKKTIVIVSHRLSTVEKCDCVAVFEHGRVKAMGPYHELMRLESGPHPLASGTG